MAVGDQAGEQRADGQAHREHAEECHAPAQPRQETGPGGCMVLIWPTIVLPMAGNWLLTAFSTVARRAGELAATWTSTVTRISSSGNTATKAEKAMFAARTPPLSSPYFLITPKTKAETRCCCCAVSTR